MPYLGICLGMQIAVIEYARNVAGLADANSGEFDPVSEHKVIDFMPGQSDEVGQGRHAAPWRLPLRHHARHTTMARCYGAGLIHERHRHRYEFNNDFRDVLQNAGLTLSGTSPDGRLVETVELTDRPFHVGVQYHPEFKSRPANKPHPLFLGFIKRQLGGITMSIHEECGVFGVYSQRQEDVASLAYYGLYALQHRGQESCGIVVNDDGVF